MADFPADYKYDSKNPFALILQDQLPADKIYEDEFLLAFKDINPKAPIHALIIPKQPHICFSDFVTSASQKELAGFFQGIKKVAAALQVSQYSLITNNGLEAGQVVFHFHVHLLANKQDK